MRLHSLIIFMTLLLGLTGCEDSATPSDQGKDSDDDVEESKGPSSADDDAEDDDEGDEPVATKDAGTSTPREAGSSSSMRSDASASSSRMDASKPVDTSKSDASTSTPSSNDGGGTASSGESPCPGNGMPCVILPLGDSITFGIGYAGSYRVKLFEKATMANQNITYVGSLQNGPSTVAGKPFPKANEGHSGWTISQIAGLVPSPALKTKADIVLLMAGTNDMYSGAGPADAPKRLGDLIDKLVAADDHMLIVVAQLTPLPISPELVKTYNAALPAIVEARAKQGKHVMLVDMHTGFPNSEIGDMVHPNQKGYERMADVWYEAIKGVLR